MDHRNDPEQQQGRLAICQSYGPDEDKFRANYKVQSVIIPKLKSERGEQGTSLDLSAIRREAHKEQGWFQVKLVDKVNGSTITIRARQLKCK